jgi:acetoin utilization protein AcuB
VSVDEIMTASPVVVRENATISEAWEVLRTLDIRHLPVVNAEHELVGIVSDRDFTTPPVAPAVARLLDDRGPSLDAPIASIMTGAPISIEQDDDVREAMELMLDHKVGAIPVVEPDGNVVGIVSYLDVLRAALE